MNIKDILLIMIVLAGVTGYFYKEKILLETIEDPTSPAQEVGSSPISGSTSTQTNYSCSGKVHCSEMTSCEEAMFYQQNCPGTKMDGDADGIPCESQWCGH